MISKNIDWEEISRQIKGSDDPQGPLHLIKTCLENPQEQTLDPYELIDKNLDSFLENLKKSFTVLNK